MYTVYIFPLVIVTFKCVITLLFNSNHIIFFLLVNTICIFTVSTSASSTTNFTPLLAATSSCPAPWLVATSVHQQSHPLPYFLYILCCIPEYLKGFIVFSPTITIQKTGSVICICCSIFSKSFDSLHLLACEWSLLLSVEQTSMYLGLLKIWFQIFEGKRGNVKDNLVLYLAYIVWCHVFSTCRCMLDDAWEEVKADRATTLDFVLFSKECLMCSLLFKMSYALLRVRALVAEQ